MAHAPAPDPDQGPLDDRPAEELLDDVDRVELRDRYYGLLQELRVLLPGVQILVAFLLTVPFATNFGEVDGVGQALYGVALTLGVLAAVAFATPTVLHRFGDRRARSDRLLWSIRVTRVGLGLLGGSLVVALGLVTRVVFGGAPSLAITAGVAVAMLLMWVVLPTRLASRGGR